MVHKLLRPRGGFTIMDPIKFLFRHKKNNNEQQLSSLYIVVKKK